MKKIEPASLVSFDQALVTGNQLAINTYLF